MRHGFVYLVALVDVFTRRVFVPSRVVYNRSSFGAESLKEALEQYGKPEISNMDQGGWFARLTFTSLRLDTKVSISMAAQDASRDNVFVERLLQL